ncbi:RNA polymerase sigma factor [Sinomonas sp. JGH33]|uniref:RNA polymerase sigma factor n=1 Tax=Sinomonas terricola TaxID=3110330 RepID=A0ABU5T332_9MICC|nr:RNA polymerase sigma factor [Sinomonas sp. JGH33]MEA5454043.1 RNA polymerase sigma factor [Sinomonas sp. JGH33]
MGESDEDLWRLCAIGDADAFGALFDRHADAVFRYCLSRCGSWHDAEELVSITFLEAWRQRTRLRLEKDTVLPWLLGVATNADRNRARASRRHAEFLARLPHSDPQHGENQADHAEAVATRLDAERTVRELLDTTAGLNDGERDVVLLCLMNGFGHAEAAVILGVQPGTVKSRLHRARAKLAKLPRSPEPADPFDAKIVEARMP